MLKHDGNYLGDSWYFVEGDEAHCFYLTCPMGIERHTAWDIAHAVSKDLVNWDIKGVILRRGEPGSYDGRCPATGSVIKKNGRYWMAYTGNWNGPQPSVALSVSDDLYHWQKIEENPVTTIDPRYYDPQAAPAPRDWLHWRDPFLFELDGKVYHYVCAKKNDGPQDQRGTLGMAVTEDMRHWQVLPPPEVDPITAELECPQVHQVNDLWYLVFSSSRSFFTQAHRGRYWGEKGRWTSYAMVGFSPMGPFKLHKSGEIIPETYPVQPYANQLVFWKGNGYLLGTVWNDAQDLIVDPVPVTFTPTGIVIKS
ncbi:MAG: family 43 glycosylhydrolase [Anaerolineae bacterium]|nr:family 43 glycosylhydrolase [Anaerolineae bacterium]